MNNIIYSKSEMLPVTMSHKRKRSQTDLNYAHYITTIEESSSNLLNKQISNEDTVNERQEEGNGDGEYIFTSRVEVKRQRKSKKETSGRTHICNLCNKSYLSYPALYTHKRNKHNIIPITGKPEIFKTGGVGNSLTKFKYNVLDSTTNVKGITESIIMEFSKICRSVYFNPNSLFYNPYYLPECDSFIRLLKYYNYSGVEKIKIPKASEKGKTAVDNILVIYLILLIEVTRENFFFELIIKFVFLLREYLNLVGWDHLRYLNDYGLYDNLKIDGEFCASINCEEIPELVNDFLSVFSEMEEFSDLVTKKELTDVTQNFCYWLFINGLTNYKLSKSETGNSGLSSENDI